MAGSSDLQGFPDRGDRLFGRKHDLNHLVTRAKHKGITAVAGRPQMGKSWLLTELARFLSTDYEPRFQVGFTESSGQTADLLLRSVIDLYTRWLSDATYRQQARVLWEQQKGDLVVGTGKAVGTLFEKLSKSIGPAAEPLGGIVKEVFEALAKVNQTFVTGNVQIPQLQYEQARDLVKMVSRLGGGGVILVLDQWEQSSSISFEATTLHTFLRHLEDWPHCHIFLGLRPEDPAHQQVKELEKSLSGPCAVYELGLMNLDAREKNALVKYVRKQVSAAAAAQPETLLQMIDGYPGVIYRWTSEYQAENMRSAKDLASVAKDAQEYRFAELDRILPCLTTQERSLAIRLALSSGYN